MTYILDDISDSYSTVEPVYDSEETTHDLHFNQTFLFDFEVVYTRIPEADSDGEADYMSDNVETRITHHLKEYGRDWFIDQDEEQIKATIYAILYEINVPPYRGIVTTLTEEIKRIINLPLEKLKKIKVTINVTAPVFPEDEIGVEEDVKYLVAGATVEAIEQHLVVLTDHMIESVGDCVICMDLIHVGSDLVGRIPCKHVFHRTCIVKWLEQTAICPLCRHVFPV